MYAGHYAAGLALKGKVPEAPTWGILVGVGVLLGYYWRRSKTDGSFGGSPVAVVVTILILHALNSPWLSTL